MTKAVSENAAPTQKVIAGPYLSHSPPTMTLANSINRPLAKLNSPKAVPFNSGGVISAIMAARIPCVQPICSPHNATPRRTLKGEPAQARIKSARTRSRMPARQQVPAIHTIRENSSRICRKRIGKAHHDHHQRDPFYRKPHLLGAQYEKRLTESGEREDRPDGHHAPVVARELLKRIQPNRRTETVACGHPLLGPRFRTQSERR